MLISPFDTIDEFTDEFTSNDFSIIDDMVENIRYCKETNLFSFYDLEKDIGFWYEH